MVSEKPHVDSSVGYGIVDATALGRAGFAWAINDCREATPIEKCRVRESTEQRRRFPPSAVVENLPTYREQRSAVPRRFTRRPESLCKARGLQLDVYLGIRT